MTFLAAFFFGVPAAVVVDQWPRLHRRPRRNQLNPLGVAVYLILGVACMVGYVRHHAPHPLFAWVVAFAGAILIVLGLLSWWRLRGEAARQGHVGGGAVDVARSVAAAVAAVLVSAAAVWVGTVSEGPPRAMCFAIPVIVAVLTGFVALAWRQNDSTPLIPTVHAVQGEPVPDEPDVEEPTQLSA